MEGAQKVDVHDRLEAVRADVRSKRGKVAGRAGDDDVDRTDLGREGGEGGGDRGVVAHVEGVPQRRRGPGDPGHGGVDLGLASAGHAKPRPGGGKGLGDSEVYAAGASGDEDVAARVVECRPHCGASLWLWCPSRHECGHTNAPSPVIARPTIRVLISRVPS